MNKKKIISNTIMFVAIIIFISVFRVIFGNDNSLLGVAVITVALALLETDLTICIWRNLAKLLIINLLMGIFTFWSSSNMWVGIVLNFLALFIVGYLFSYNLRKSIIVPFGLQYLFMLFTPVSGYNLLNRILALVFGAFFAMGMQLLANKDKASKAGMKTVENICENILLKISLLKESKDLSKVNADIEEAINNLKRIVYDKRVKNFYLTKHAKIITNIIWTLERMNILLDNLSEEKEKESYIQLLQDVYNEVENIRNKNFNKSSLVFKDTNVHLNKLYMYEFVNLIESLSNNISQIETLTRKEKNSIDTSIEIPKSFHNLAIHKRNFTVDSLRVSYGIRLGIVVALTAFITQYFHLSEGRWMVYTQLSLIQPYSENCKMKSRQRLEGTLIGALIVFVSFALIDNTNARYLIILLAGYLNPFATKYRDLIICVTVSAVASMALVGGITKFAISRIIFVFIGTGIALLANKYILPYKIKDGNKYLVGTYNRVIKQMFEDMKKSNAKHSMENLFLIPAFIEDRMKLINFGTNSTKEREFIYNQKILVNSIYNYHLFINRNKNIIEDNIYIIDEIKLLINDNESKFEKVSSKIQKYIENVQSLEQKFLVKNILDMIENFNKVQGFVISA